jgi:hypothetical protein
VGIRIKLKQGFVMPISIVDVVQYVYPGQFEAGNVVFYADNQFPGGIGIQVWNVNGIPEPSIQSLVDLFPSYQQQYDNTQIFNACTKLVADKLDSVAQEKQYSTAVACASYATSSNAQWASEAQVFIHWRDSVFEYAINIQTKVQQGQMPCPTIQEFMSGLPIIVWPS